MNPNANSASNPLVQDQNNQLNTQTLENTQVIPQKPEVGPNSNGTTYTILPENPSVPEPASPKKGKGKILAIFLILLMFLLFASGVTYALAYEKINLPEKYKDTQKLISVYVINLPFMPKTPEFVLGKSILTLAEIQKESFDLSIALSSDNVSVIPMLSNLDVSAKGAIDFSDPQNIRYSVDSFITPEFNIELKKNDLTTTYFNVKKIPSQILAIMGINASDYQPITNLWVSFENKTLESNARQNIKDKNNPIHEMALEYVEKYKSDEILKKVKLSEITENGKKYFKLSLVSDTEVMDLLDQIVAENTKNKYGHTSTYVPPKFSSTVKDFNFELYVEKDTYYLHKQVLTANIDTSANLLQNYAVPGTGFDNKKYQISSVLILDDYNKEVVINTPSDFITFEEFTDKLLDIYNNSAESLQ